MSESVPSPALRCSSDSQPASLPASQPDAMVSVRSLQAIQPEKKTSNGYVQKFRPLPASFFWLRPHYSGRSLDGSRLFIQYAAIFRLHTSRILRRFRNFWRDSAETQPRLVLLAVLTVIGSKANHARLIDPNSLTFRDEERERERLLGTTRREGS